MRSQEGEAAAKLLMLLLVVAVAIAVASPWLLRSTKPKEEASAIATLRRIHAAQKDYHGGTRLYASMSKLANTKLFDGVIGDGPFTRDGYTFTHTTAGGWQRFCTEAVPEAIGGKPKDGPVFAIDESGKVQQYEPGASPCYAGVLQSPGTPVR